MNHEDHDNVSEPKSAIFKKKSLWIPVAVGILLDFGGFTFLGNLLIFIMITVVANKYFINDLIVKFQTSTLPRLMNWYEATLRRALTGWRPVKLLVGTFILLILSFVILGISVGTGRVGIEFFPKGDPNQLYVYLKLPSGSNVNYTDSITRVLETKVNKVLENDKGQNPLVESIISNVAVGAGDPMRGDRSNRAELGRIQVNFVEFEKRHGKSTEP
jgi:multidrug efflux pump subunit AcrB